MPTFTITIPAASVGSDLVDVPYDIYLNDVSGTTDVDMSLVFTELPGVDDWKKLHISVDGTQVYGELSNWTPGSNKAVIRIKIPLVSSTVDTVITGDYGATNADQSAFIGITNSTPAEAVWNSGYFRVYHLDNDPSGGAGCILDSTSNQSHSTPVGTFTGSELVAMGPDVGIEFNGVDQNIPVDLVANMLTGTVEISTKAVGVVASLDGIFGSTADYSANAISFMASDLSKAGVFVDNSAFFFGSVTIADWFVENDFSYTIDPTTFNLSHHTEGQTLSGAGGSMFFSSASNIGYWVSATRRFPGVMRCLRISSVVRSEDWRDFNSLSVNDNIGIYHSGIVPLTSVYVELLQLYSLQGDLVYAELLQKYHLTDDVHAELLQRYHLSFVIELLQTYGDASVVVAELAQYYKDAPVVVAGLLQKYGAAGVVVAELLQKYEGPELIVAELESRYNLLNDPTVAGLIQGYSLEENNSIIAELLQAYSLPSDSVRRPECTVTMNGTVMHSTQWTLSYSLSQYAGYASFTLSSFAEWDSLDYSMPVVLSVAGTDYHFVITDLHKNESAVKRVYTVEARSEAVLLDFPYASELTDDSVVYGTSSEIVSRVLGQTVDWQLPVDPPQTESSFQVSGKSPLGAARDLIRELGGRLQSDPDGSIYVCSFYEHNTNIYGTLTPDYVFSTSESFTTLSTDHDKRDGFNKFEVSDEDTSDAYSLDSETISVSNIQVMAVKAPWSSEAVTLRTSELSGVTITPEGVNTREFIETIELVSGEGTVSNYISQIDDVQYDNRIDLGNIEFNEDGKITVQSTEHTLVTITYTNKFWLWNTYNKDSEEVQFILETA